MPRNVDAWPPSAPDQAGTNALNYLAARPCSYCTFDPAFTQIMMIATAEGRQVFLLQTSSNLFGGKSQEVAVVDELSR